MIFFTKAGKKGDWLDFYQGVITKLTTFTIPAPFLKKKT